MGEKKPKLKADDFVEYDDEKKMNWTNFEELQARFEELKNVLNEHTEILRENKLNRKETIEAPYYDDDKVFRELEGEN